MLVKMASSKSTIKTVTKTQLYDPFPLIPGAPVSLDPPEVPPVKANIGFVNIIPSLPG